MTWLMFSFLFQFFCFTVNTIPRLTMIFSFSKIKTVSSSFFKPCVVTSQAVLCVFDFEEISEQSNENLIVI